ncbi:MAG: 50S ribosomal protein L10 [Candidatus Caldatribacteriota bacterium]|nr:50S ribosomal protein L10 [Atribacterota bacterium]MDD4765626.1 50S ribosomal protein L10 [Atribacterota bacterium]MDI9596959.1 50S ribosomal protein L10 [Atribacterota bacterium]
MPLNKEEKKLVVEELCEEFKKSSGIVLTDYKGLDVELINKIRSDLRINNIRYKVYKNTLIKRAANETGFGSFVGDLSGCTAIAFSEDEPILVVKLLNQFYQQNKEKFKLKRALIEEKIFFEEELDRIANLPTKEELLSKMLGNLKSPITSFVFILKSPIYGLVNVLEQIRKQKENTDK